MILLETERLFLRDWVPDDWKRYKPLATDPRVLKYIGRGEPSSDERIKQFVSGGIEMAKSRGWILWPVIHRDDAELIGFCGFSDSFPPDVEIGWRLKPEYWGKGLATEIARAVLHYGWNRFQFGRLISVIQPENRASIRVAEKLGMTIETPFVHEGIEVLRYAKKNPRLLELPRDDFPTSEQQASRISLREVQESDLGEFFEHQRDPEAVEMAAFPPRRREEFMKHWAKIMADPAVRARTILLDGDVAGNVICWEQDGKRLIGYWLGRRYWGKGVATHALTAFVAAIHERPLHAHVAKQNIASIRVLEKCGFQRAGESRAAAPTGGETVEEFVYSLI
jgi:RimJ/RimL family protein N-acetyltransferase